MRCALQLLQSRDGLHAPTCPLLCGHCLEGPAEVLHCTSRVFLWGGRFRRHGVKALGRLLASLVEVGLFALLLAMRRVQHLRRRRNQGEPGGAFESQGRPLGFLIAWLEAGHQAEFDSKDEVSIV